MRSVVRLGVGFAKFLVSLGLAISVLLVGAYFQVRGALPPYSGHFEVAGLKAPVEIQRDKNAVPHIIAAALILVMAGNPVILAAHGMERALNSQLQLQLSEQRELALLKQQAAAQAALQPAAGVSLASAQQAGVKTAENGVSVIDIAAPSERGVSHNLLSSFNVPAAGLILNNSKDPMISILGGWTDGNRRLTAGAASLILAEVTSRGVLHGVDQYK